MQDRTQTKQPTLTSLDTLSENKASFLERKTSQRLKKNQLISSYYAYTSLSFQMGALMSISYWAGLKLDQYFHLIPPIFASLLAVGAIILSIYMLISQVTKM